nr:benzyl alcohol O-benzoyltransferase [Tanacetum cinerariifolium]
MRGTNPASVIREALAKMLVFYYPFAGRLKEGLERKLMVDCTGEGVLFIEAEADVTRLSCGGFIFAIRLNHTMSDAAGLVQFLMALGEIAKGASTPSTLPVWRRELLSARNLPRVTFNHYEYKELVDTKGTVTPLDDIAHKSFFFGPAQIAAIRRFVLLHLKNCTMFEVLTAYIWRCRTIALQPDPEDEMRIMCMVNAHKKFNPSIPVGFYGNAFCCPATISTARDLVKKPLDVTYAGFDNVDFGWGKATFAGPSRAGVGAFPSASFYTPFTNYKGESGIVVPICLSNVAMNKFEQELNNMFVQAEGNLVVQEHNLPTISKL